MKIKDRKKKLFLLFISAFIFSFILLISIDVWTNRQISSGWIWSRLSRHIYHLFEPPTNNYPILISRSTPAEFPFRISLSLVTGTSIVDAFYMSILFLAPFSLYLYTKNFINNRLICSLVVVAIFITLFSNINIATGYQIGWFLFPLFVFLIIIYIQTWDKRFIVLSLIILIVTKLFAPHMEIWSVSFLLTITIFLIITSKINAFRQINLKNRLKSLKIYSLISISLLIAFQPKGEDFLHNIYLGIYDLDIVTHILNYIGLGVNGQEQSVLEYGVTPRSPLIVSTLNQITTLIIGIGVLLAIFWWLKKLLKDRNYFLENINKLDLYIWALFIAPIPHGLMKLAINQPGYLMMVLNFVGIILIYYTFKKRSDLISSTKDKTTKNIVQNKKLPSIQTTFVLIIVLLILSHHMLFIAHDIDNPVGPDESNEAAALWIIENQDSPTLLTDWDTHNLLLYYLAENRYNIFQVGDLRYTDSRYAFTVGDGNQSVGRQFDFFVIDALNKHTPLHGGGGYQHFQPIENYEKEVRNNENINLVYSSGDYEIYTSNV